MIKRLVEWCLWHRYVVWILSIILAILAYFACIHMTVEAYPELADVNVMITTQMPGLAAEEIEKQITIPLERALFGLPELVSMRSTSTFALSWISLIFNNMDDEYFARERVLNAIDDAILPDGIKPKLTPLTGSGGEIYRYILQSDVKNLMALSEIQRWLLIPSLKQVPGVVDVNNFGGFTKEYELLLEPIQLKRYHVSLNDVVSRIQDNNISVGGGRSTRGDQNYTIRALGQIHSLEDLGSVIVKQYQFNPVFIRDLGQLRYGHKEREGILSYNHNADAIEGIVLMRKHENPSKVLVQLHREIDKLKPKLEAMGVKFITILDREDLVHLTIAKVRATVIHGILIVFVVLYLFLGSLRSAIVVSVSIPAALASTFILVQLTHMTANLFSLGAIDFGIIVDASIVMMEAILRRREQNPHKNLSISDTLDTSLQVARPIFYASLIIISCYLPLFSFDRAEGRLFAPMAATICYALMGALICAMTLIPGLSYTMFRQQVSFKESRFLAWLEKRYKKNLQSLIYKPKPVYWAGCMTVLAIILLSYHAGREFLPEMDEGSLWLQVTLPRGVSLERASGMAAELRDTLLSYPEVSYVVTQLGRSDEASEPWNISHLEVPVGLHPYHEWPRHQSKADFIAELLKKFANMPGMTVGVSQPIIDNVNDLAGGTHSPLTLRIYSDDLKEARHIGEQIVSILKGIPGTALASIYQEAPIPQLVVNIDRAKIARYGLNVSDVSNVIETALSGSPITRVYVGKRMYNAVVRFPVKNKHSIEDLGGLFVKTAQAGNISLAELADISYQTGESSIAHENGKRVLTIRIDNRGRDLSAYLAEAKRRIHKNIYIDAEQFQLEWAGQFESQERAQNKLFWIALILLLLISVILFLVFQKIHYVLLLLGILPMAALGGLLVLYLSGETLNIATAVGFIALIGVSVQNGVIMLSNIRRWRQLTPSLKRAVIYGANERLRPVMMTATVASLGMLPAALASGVGTDVQRNLASIIVGGLPVSTLMTLFILPIYYYHLERYLTKRTAGEV